MLRPMMVHGRPHWETNFPKEAWPLFEEFRNFLVVTWDHLGLPAPTLAQFETANRLQYGADSAEIKYLMETRRETLEQVKQFLMYGKGSREDIIRCFRSMGKSYITAAFVVWLMLRNPRDEKVLVLSASSGKAKQFVSQAKGLIYGMAICAWLLEGVREGGAPRRDRAEEFDVQFASNTQSPSMLAKGIDGQITGSRATTIIPDDIEVEGNSRTEAARAVIMNKIRNDLAPIRKTEHGMGDCIFLGTPQTEESIYNPLVEEMGYSCFCIPVRYPSADKVASYTLTAQDGSDLNILAPYLRARHDAGELPHGALTDTRYSEEEVIRLEADKGGRANFMLQYMLDTTLSDAERYPLKQFDLIVMSTNPMKAPLTVQWGRHSDGKNLVKGIQNLGFTGDYLMHPLMVDAEWRNYDGKVLYVDPAGRGKDEFAWAVVGSLGGTLYLMHIGAHKGDPQEAMRRAALDAVKFDVNVVEIEPNYGQGMAIAVLSPMIREAYKKAGIQKALTEGNKVRARDVASNPMAGCVIQEAEWSQGQKEVRIIDWLEPVMTTHRLVVSEDILRADAKSAMGQDQLYSFLYQLTHITRERGALRHDDRLDAVAGAIAHFMRSMELDAEEQKRELLAQEKDRVVEDFLWSQQNAHRFNGRTMRAKRGWNPRVDYSDYGPDELIVTKF